MAVQTADVPTERAETDSSLDRGRTLCRLLRMQTLQLVRAATKNVARFDEESTRTRDAQGSAASETFLL